MKHGFVKVAAATPDIRVADVKYNTEKICQAIEEASDNCAKILVFPELCVTGYTCGDLFTQDILLKSAKEALFEIAKFTAGKDILVFAGLPLEMDGKLYNVAAALNEGKVIGLTTKTFLPNYGEFYEMRQFTPGPEEARYISFGGEKVPFGPRILFEANEMDNLIVAAEICEDVWSPIPPSIRAALEGATVIVNCSASDETIGKDTYRRELISGQSARLISGYVYANAGEGESTTDLVFGGHNIIAENEDGMYIIDQHAAAERINYEKVLAALKEKVIPIDLLIPVKIELASNEFLIIKNHLDILNKYGFFAEEFGMNTIIVRSHPQWIEDDIAEECIRKVIDIIITKEEFDFDQFVWRMAATMACRMSVKANDYLSYDDQVWLLDTLRCCENPFTCPHGRPTIITYTKYDLEKLFKRSLD